MLAISDVKLYSVVPGVMCRRCSGIILKRVTVFSSITCGGNPEVGCPKCRTLSSAKIIWARDDIVPACEFDEKIKYIEKKIGNPYNHCNESLCASVKGMSRQQFTTHHPPPKVFF